MPIKNLASKRHKVGPYGPALAARCLIPGPQLLEVHLRLTPKHTLALQPLSLAEEAALEWGLIVPHWKLRAQIHSTPQSESKPSSRPPRDRKRNRGRQQPVTQQAS